MFGASVMYLMSLNKPRLDSFEPFLKTWYTTQYFPRFSEAASRELNERSARKARSSDMLGSIMDKVKSTWVDVTSGIQSQMVYELIVKNNFPPRATDIRIGYVVAVNLGSRVEPMDVYFVGLCGTWFKSPFDGIDFENIAILQDMKDTKKTK